MSRPDIPHFPGQTPHTGGAHNKEGIVVAANINKQTNFSLLSLYSQVCSNNNQYYVEDDPGMMSEGEVGTRRGGRGGLVGSMVGHHIVPTIPLLPPNSTYHSITTIK